MSKQPWNGIMPDIESMLRDQVYHGKLTTDQIGGGTQKVTENSDGTLSVDWYGPSSSSRGHFHFVFEIDASGRPVNGRLVHD